MSQNIDDFDAMKEKKKKTDTQKNTKEGHASNVYCEFEHRHELQILHNVQNVDGMEKAENTIKPVDLLNIPCSFHIWAHAKKKKKKFLFFYFYGF